MTSRPLALALALLVAIPALGIASYVRWPRPQERSSEEERVLECGVEAQPEEFLIETAIEETVEEILEDFEDLEMVGLGEAEAEFTAGPPDADAAPPLDAKDANATLGIDGGEGGRRSSLRGRRSETYAPIDAVSAFELTADDPRVTFAADVDTGAHTNPRRMILRERRLPPSGAVRVEEMANDSPHGGVEPAGADPIGASIEISSCPWAPEHRLAHVVLRTAPIPRARRQPAALVFLVDALGLLTEELADHGDGAYPCIDSELEARKVLVSELGSTLEVANRAAELSREVALATGR